MIKQQQSTSDIKVEDIVMKDRKREDLGDITQLADSIDKFGLLHPITVKVLDDGKYRLLAGGRRLGAVTHLKLPHIKCIVYHRDLTDLELRSIELIENIDRKDLTWREEDQLIREIHELHLELHGKSAGGMRADLSRDASAQAQGWSMDRTAELISKTRQTVSLSLARAEATALSPRIASCKTGADAWKMLQGAKAQVNRQMRVEAYEEKQGDMPEAIIKRRLVDSYIVADAVERIRKVKSNSIDWVELDPPYGIDLGNKRKARNDTKPGMEEYIEIGAVEYEDFMDRIIGECSRVLTSEGWLICWFGMDWYEMIYKTLIDRGFLAPTLPAIWTKGAYQAQSMQPSMYLANSYETFFYARKPNAQITKKGRINEFSFKNISPQHKSHPTEKPIELMVDILGTFCQPNSTGLVPFLGSGNTILAANNLKMLASGFDLSQDHKNGYVVKVNEGRVGQFRSYQEVAV